MARLKARGRTEIFRVWKERDVTPKAGDSNPVVWRKKHIILGSDGNVLEKTEARWQDGMKHTYDWKIIGKIKAGLPAESMLETYAKAGYTIEHASGLSNFDRAYYAALAQAAKAGTPLPVRAGNGGTVLRTEAKAAKEKAAKEKRVAKVTHEKTTKHGAGFYIRNRTTSAMGKWAAEIGPLPSLDAALEKAFARYQHLAIDLKVNYLLPVQIVEAKSRDDAEWDRNVHVWWTNGKMRGAPVHPGQLGLAGINGRS